MSDILDQLLTRMPDTYQKTVGFPTYDLLAAVALQLEDTQTLVDLMRTKLYPENLSGNELDEYIFPRSGLIRKEATFATGVLHVTGNGTVTEGDIFQSQGGIQFVAIETVVVSGEADVLVTCMKDGTVGNVAAGSVTQMPVTIQGITSVTNPEPMSGGYDEETDEAYYERYLIQIRTPPTSGNIYHYMMWALECSGVGKVKVFPLGHGENTVDVVIVDSDGKPADDDLVSLVQEYIDPGSTGEGYGQAPIGARCYVSAATARSVALSVTVYKLSTDSAEGVTATIVAAVSAYLGDIAFEQTYVSYAQIAGAILSAAGVLDFIHLTLDGGYDNITIEERECAVLGTVDITYAE